VTSPTKDAVIEGRTFSLRPESAGILTGIRRDYSESVHPGITRIVFAAIAAWIAA